MDILSIEKECFEPGIRYDSLTFLYYILAYRDRLVFYVAEMGRVLVGYVLAIVENEICHLVSIAVRRRYRKRGIGGSLLDLAMNECRAKGAGKAVLEVAVDNKDALDFYSKRGWRIIGVLDKYYGNRDAYLMERPL
ncbi:MAG: GNAT family N-acetyltransferase [Desulfurococcaceae archaeon]